SKGRLRFRHSSYLNLASMRQLQTTARPPTLTPSLEALRKKRQLELLRRNPDAYGGELLKTRRGRARPRPLSTRCTMHLVLRSSKAVGAWSFLRPENAQKIEAILKRCS